MRRREGGTGCGACGLGYAAKLSGGIGAPPGLTMKPCQELADVLVLRYRPLAYLSASANRKRGPLPETSANSMRYRFTA